MTGKLKSKFQDKKYRDAYVAEHLKLVLASQIQALRNKEDLTQAELAHKIGTTQNVISRLEDPDYGKFTLQTLLDLAAAFEVSLLVKFVTFDQFVNEYRDISPAALAVSSFTDETDVAKTVIAPQMATDANIGSTFTYRVDEGIEDNYEYGQQVAA